MSHAPTRIADFKVLNRENGNEVCIIRSTVRECVLSDVESHFAMESGDATEEQFEIIEVVA